MDTPLFALPLQDGIPVLSPLQQTIERDETLRCLRGQVDCGCARATSLRRALNSVDLLVLEQIEEELEGGEALADD